MNSAVASFLVIFAPLPVIAYSTPQAPQPTRITGRLIDQAGSEAQLETVELRLNSDSEVVAVAQTDGKGLFSFPSVAPREYSLTTEGRPGYKRFTKTIVVPAGKDLDLGVLQLQPLPSLCDAVVVLPPGPAHPSPLPPDKPSFLVSGRVIDDKGTPIRNAIVVLWDTCSGAEAKTDKNGYLKVRFNYACDCPLRITAPGFNAFRVQVRNWKGSRVALGDIAMHPLGSQ